MYSSWTLSGSLYPKPCGFSSLTVPGAIALYLSKCSAILSAPGSSCLAAKTAESNFTNSTFTRSSSVLAVCVICRVVRSSLEQTIEEYCNTASNLPNVVSICCSGIRCCLIIAPISCEYVWPSNSCGITLPSSSPTWAFDILIPASCASFSSSSQYISAGTRRLYMSLICFSLILYWFVLIVCLRRFINAGDALWSENSSSPRKIP